MKFFKKFNKGLILTVIVITLLIVHLVNIEAKRSAEKPEIEKCGSGCTPCDQGPDPAVFFGR